MAPQAKKKYAWNLGIHWVLLGASLSDGNSENPIATTMDWLENSKRKIRPLKNKGLRFSQMKPARLTEMPAKNVEYNMAASELRQWIAIMVLGSTAASETAVRPISFLLLVFHSILKLWLATQLKNKD